MIIQFNFENNTQIPSVKVCIHFLADPVYIDKTSWIVGKFSGNINDYRHTALCQNKLFGAFTNCENRPVASLCLSTWNDRHDEAWDNTVPTGHIFIQSGI